MRRIPPVTSGQTETGEGPVPHRLMRVAGHTFRAPVVLQDSHSRGSLPRPVRVDDRLVYALPGGGRVVG
jgi:hypothetical protein